MRDIAKLEHLLTVLRGRAFASVDLSIPLQWAEAGPDRRAEMIAGPHPDWADVTAETPWGAPQSYFWFAGRVTIPEALAGRRVYLWVEAQFGRVMGRSDPQCLIRVNGDIVQGADFNHRELLLSASAKAGESFDILIEAGTIEDRRQMGFSLQLTTHDAETEALYFDLKTPLDVARHLPETDHRRDVILTCVYQALNTVDLRPGNPARFAASVAAARDVASRIYSASDTEAVPEITVIGHTHIDVAWLWRVRETRQKMARSMATMLTLMQEYPDYRFMYNQGYLLDTLNQDYPELFDGIKAAHARGQFEVEGALWLEPDANITSGESLIRHILKGVRYHQHTFGVTPKIVWLPDTFGYSAALPQIMKLAGLEVFVTHKMSWNDTNRMPNETFWWQGLDGTRVPTYFLTTQPMESTSIGTTYCPDLKASHVMGTWRRYAQKGTNSDLMLVYGHGDGGGGPTREMLEHIRRMERGIPGAPRVKHGHMGPFLNGLLAKMHATPESYPTWVGELYLEFHRGTFTSVAEVKRNNRRAEAELREIEALASLAHLRGQTYPAAQIAALWDIALLNQFHDILPGSSIDLVYQDSAAEYAAFFAQAQALKGDLVTALGQGALVANCFGQPRGGLLQIKGAPCAINGKPSQSLTRADGRILQAAPLDAIPATGAVAVALTASTGATGTAGLSVSLLHLENAHLRAAFDGSGRLTSLIDKSTGRQALAGPGNRLQAFRDLPAQFDAWDIDTTYQDQFWEIDHMISAEVAETGPYRAAIRFEWRYESSTLVQVASLEADAALIEFDTYIDWREPHTLVKAAFPLDIAASHATAEVQFGHVSRPTHANTSWDQARFECPMHRWVDMSEPDFGVALLNDCKYGYDAAGTTLRLTVLRAPTWPWDGADIGHHQLRYGLMLHHGRDAVAPMAEAFNQPLELLRGEGAMPLDLGAIITTGTPAIAAESLKRAEDSDDLIIRLWERTGRRQTSTFSLAPEIVAVGLSDLMEQPIGNLAITDGKVALGFKPFEIKTLRLTRSQ
jgi:alpha-mannosidase